MTTSPYSHGKAFPSTAALLSFAYNLLVLLSCKYIPDDPLRISAVVATYAWMGSVFSLLGIVGVLDVGVKLPNFPSSLL